MVTTRPRPLIEKGVWTDARELNDDFKQFCVLQEPNVIPGCRFVPLRLDKKHSKCHFATTKLHAES